MKKEAIVITPACPVTRYMYGVRLEKRGQDWYKTWAFPISSTKNDDYQASIPLNRQGLATDAAYPGCPYCHSSALIQCGDCNGVYCYRGEQVSVCPFCGNEGDVSDEGWDSVEGGKY